MKVVVMCVRGHLPGPPSCPWSQSHGLVRRQHSVPGLQGSLQPFFPHAFSVRKRRRRARETQELPKAAPKWQCREGLTVFAPRQTALPLGSSSCLRVSVSSPGTWDGHASIWG